VSRPAVPPAGERFARRVVTGCAVAVVAACFGFSFGNVLALGRYLGVPEWVAWLVAPAVDLTVVGLIVGVRHLSLRGVAGRRLRPARAMLLAAGLATWALNTAHALFVRGHLGVVAYDSLAPLLLIGWAEVGPWFLRQFRAATDPDTSTAAGSQAAAGRTVPADKRPVPAAAPVPVPTAPDAPVPSAADAAAPSRPRTAPAEPRATRPSPPSPASSAPPAGGRDGRRADRTGRADWAALAEQARRLAAAHLATHGRPISRDALRRTLRVSNQVASQLLRTVNDQPLPAPTPAAQDGTADPAPPTHDGAVPQPAPSSPEGHLANGDRSGRSATVPTTPSVGAAAGPDRDGDRG
jgi:hypothetical protein